MKAAIYLDGTFTGVVRQDLDPETLPEYEGLALYEVRTELAPVAADITTHECRLVVEEDHESKVRRTVLRAFPKKQPELPPTIFEELLGLKNAVRALSGEAALTADDYRAQLGASKETK